MNFFSVKNWLPLGCLIFSCSSLSYATELLSIPVFVKYSLMQQVMLREMFKGSGHTAVYRLDSSGCTSATFAKPHLSGAEGLLQVRANVLVKFGTSGIGKKCTEIKYWSGSTVVKGKPLIIGTDSLTVQFKVVKADVYDTHGQQLSSGLVTAALEGHLNPLLDQFKVDLKPQLKQLNSVLPFMLPGYSSEQIEQLIASVHLGNVDVRNDGLNIMVQMLVDRQSMLKFLPGLLQ